MVNCPQHSNSIELIKGVFCVNRSKAPIFLGELESQIYLTPCTAPYILAFNPEQIWSYLHVWMDSGHVTFSTHLAKKWLQVFPTPTRHTSSCLYNATRWVDINSVLVVQ